MKKSLILLPIAGLFLASCGESTGELPSGGDSVDPTKPEDVANYATRLADCVEKTVVGSKNGVKLNSSIKIEDFSMKLEGDADISAKDLEFTFSLGADFLDKESIKDWKVAAELSANGNLKFSLPNPAVNLDLNLDGFKVAAYLNEGVIYADLSNEKLASIVKTVIDQVAGDQKPLILPIVNEILVRNKIAGMLDGVEVTNLSSDIIDAKTKLMIASYSSGFIDKVSKMEDYKDLLKFVSYSDGRLGLAVSSSDLSKYAQTGTEISGKMNASVLFGKEGKLESIQESGEFGVKVVENDKQIANINYKGETSISVEYGPISMPSFLDYVDSKIPTIIKMIMGTEKQDTFPIYNELFTAE